MRWHPGAIALAVSIVVLVLPLLVWALPAAADGGVVEGRLRNGTAGAATPGGLEVTLAAPGRDGRPDVSRRVVADEQGTFRFASVDTTAGYTYTVSATYQNVAYRSAPVTFAPGEATKPVELAIFETTDSDAAVSVELAHTVLQPDTQNQGLWAIEVLVFTNSGDRTYVGNPQRAVDGKPATLLFSLPEGAQHVEPMQGLDPARLVDVSNGFADTAPLAPGRLEVAYSVMVPLRGGAVSYARAADYRIKRFTALVLDSGARLDAGQLLRGEPVEMEGQRYQVFIGQDLAPGSAIALRFSGVPTAQTDQSNLIKLVTVAVGALAVAGLSLHMWRRRSSRAVVRGSAGDREQLLAKLAELDDAFEAGEMDEEEYRAARSAQKRRLAELWQARVEA